MVQRLTSSAADSPRDANAPVASALAGALQASSIEVSARHDAIAQLHEFFPPGTEVSITFLPADDYRRNIAMAAALRRAGFEPILHLSARQTTSREQLEDFLARATGEADTRALVLIGGDTFMPRGPFHSATAVLESGLLQANGIAEISFAGHPEGHTYFEAQAGIALLKRKVELTRQAGMKARIITQFCFSAVPIIDYLAKVDAEGIDVPIRVGLAGPATPATLLKFGLRCGVGESIRAMRDHVGRFGRLLTEWGPDGIANELAQARVLGQRVAAFHFFPFGGVRKTGRWIKARLDGDALTLNR